MKSTRIHPKHLTGFTLIALTSLLVLLGYFWSRSQSELANNAYSSNVTHSPVSPLSKSDRTNQTRVSEAYGKLPLSFEANHGQTDSAVKFISRGSDYSLFLTPTEAVLSLRNGERKIESDGLRSPGSPIRASHPSPRPDTVLRMKIVGANPDPEPQITGLEELPGKVNYFIGNDPKKWRTNVSTYAKVKYQNVYPGVGLIYYGNQRQLEYDFVLEPGADPNQIRLGFSGAKKIEIDETGDLVLTTDGGEVRHRKPVVYQEVDGRRVEVEAAYELDGENYGFWLGPYDRTRPLILDPAVLVYAGYIGGAGFDSGTGIAVDGTGNAYVTGSTASSAATFPVTSGPDLTSNGGTDAFVAKVNAAGTALVYVGYIGGSNTDQGTGIAVDGTGNAYVTGYTNSSNVPVTGGPDLTFNGSFDAFVAKVNSAGTALVYAGYIGGSGPDFGLGIAVDGMGNAYVTGDARSSEATFPVTVGPDLTYNANGDAFVAKVNVAGTALDYAGYIGGLGGDVGQGIGVDGTGNAYVSGVTGSTEATFPVTVGPDLTYNGNDDAFVAKVNAAGTALVYAGYIGGTGYDAALGIAVGGTGNAYVTGYSIFSPAFPVTVGPISSSAFVAKVDVAGTSLDYARYIAGTRFGQAIAVDGTGNAYVTGTIESDHASFPATDGPDLTFNGIADAFVAKVNAAGTALVYAGFIGGSDGDNGRGIAVDGTGNAYVTGDTRSTEATFPVTAGPDLTFNGGGVDAFVAKIGDQPLNQPPISVCQSVTKSADNNCQVTVTPQEVNNGSSDPDGDPLTLGLSPAGPYSLGTTTVTLTVTDDDGASATCTATVTVVDDTPPTITPPPAVTVNADAGSCSATGVVLGTPTVGDNCSVASTTNNAPSAFPLGGTTVTWTVTDSSGNTNTATQLVTVVNPNPVVTMTGPPSGSIYAAGTAVNFTGTYTDTGGGTHTASWMFDTLNQAATVVEPVGSTPGSANTSYTFNTPGVYLVKLTVNDSCGGTGIATTVGGFDAMVVVYDPNGGFVTGGGWINSPAGAYVPNPSLTGKANFGFVSKYQNGASVPTGNTEFQFKAGNLNFKSTAYEWLVVAGKKAQYKGSGTVNGTGDYRFMLTVIDGDLPGGGGMDKFRIRIWNNNGGGLVYDNQMNALDSDDPTTVLGGGSIFIHKP